jgi:hypothetical protein
MRSWFMLPWEAARLSLEAQHLMALQLFRLIPDKVQRQDLISDNEAPARDQAEKVSAASEQSLLSAAAVTPKAVPPGGNRHAASKLKGKRRSKSRSKARSK